MWLDLPFSQVSRRVEQNVHTTSSFPNPLSESEEQQSWGCSKILLSFFMRFGGHFFYQISNSSNVYVSSSRLWAAISSSSSSSLPSRNRGYHLETFDRFTASSRKRFAPILVFLSQINRLWNKLLWQLPVHLRHPWRIKKTDFTRQVITFTLSKINKRNSVCERMLFDSA
jgi:hypothetical protein